MKTVDCIMLSQALGLVKEPLYVLGTTYTLSLAFFESVVLPCIGRKKLKYCLLLCDRLGYRRVLDEAPALLGAGQEYIVEAAPTEGAFHAKVWVLVGESEAALLVGSGNLTQAGFIGNAELFEVLHFTRESLASTVVMAGIGQFVSGLSSLWPATPGEAPLCVQVLGQIRDALAGIPVAPADASPVRFIHSFAGPLLDQLPVAPDARELRIAAPFFGASTRGVEALAQRYPKAAVHVFPAVHSGDSTDVPLARLKKTRGISKVSRLLVAPKKTAFAHLKLYGIASGQEEAWLCCTSANCTRAAWEGPNVEAGLVRKVDLPTLERYFAPDREELPSAMRGAEEDKQGAASIQVSASESGAGLDVHLQSPAAAGAPWRDVEVEVRAGSHVGTCRRPQLFEERPRVHLPWSAFPGWTRPRIAAMCLRLHGVDAGGAPVTAACLVENRMLLTADPLHRRAFRGALALLDAEGAPELADVAALFTMARDLFDGDTIRIATVRSDRETGEAVDSPRERPEAIPLWPPVADTHDLKRAIFPSGSGHLRWFQRILGALLEKEEHGAPSYRATVDRSPEDAEEGDALSVQEQKKGAGESTAQRAALRMWQDARHQADTMADRLHKLCPNEEQAAKLWPVSLFMFLATLAVYRSAHRIAPDARFETTAEELCDEFLKLLLHPRRQHEDFCPPRGFRYRSEVFPPLAEDLRATYGAKVHRDVSALMLAVVADKKMRSEAGLFPEMWRRYLSLVCEPETAMDEDLLDMTYRLWRRYVGGPDRPVTPETFRLAYEALRSLR